MIKLDKLNRIPPMPYPQDLLEKAFRRAKKKQQENAKLDSFKSCLIKDLNNIVKSFPSIDGLPLFYKELIEYTVGIVKLKKSLATVEWASKQISKIAKNEKHARALFGRASSIVKKLSKDLEFLDNARREIDSFPVIKDMFTACITGFPNVGKTTLLSLITKSMPEIKPYPFTTKRINIGYLENNNIEIQFLDTPGTLNRINKMNNIELQSFLAMRDLADIIIFVIDSTMEVKKQIRLLVRIESFKKPIVVFVSKTNLLCGDERVSVLDKIKNSLEELKKYGNEQSESDASSSIITDENELKVKLLKFASSYYKSLLLND